MFRATSCHPAFGLLLSFVSVPFVFLSSLTWFLFVRICAFFDGSYAKPTDFKRKKLALFTEKQHYMHVTVNIRRI
eukprot:m.346147 g.346147  ORF g.346147 m.346147 type:complete len:75 (-) comp55827_c2_seq5:118-342(-)